MNFKKLTSWLIVIGLLVAIAYLSAWIRMGTYNAKVILDYDPWWFYRYAENLIENNLQPLKWDSLSFFPPGRPVQPIEGWPYLMITIHKVSSFFTNITFMDAAKLAPVVMVALTIIPAFFVGKLLSNKWAGVATALFATLAPTFIGVSMAGYCDTDAPVVFYSFLVTYVTLLAVVKRKIPYYILAVILNMIFIYTWFFGWYIIFFLVLSIPGLFLFRMLEQIIHERKLYFDTKKVWAELKPIAFSILIIFVALNVISTFLYTLRLPYLGIVIPSIEFIKVSFGFVSGTGLIVNISVAELQTLDIFAQWGQIAGRTGQIPFYLTIALAPLVLYKLYKRVKIHFAEIFLFIWAIVTFYMITRGVRFSLQFSVATAIASGYVIGEMIRHFKKNFITISIFGVIMVYSLFYVSEAIQIGYTGIGMEVSQNWIDMLDWLKENADEDALLATWWDPGHIMAGYTGLRVHADGAHCNPAECYPYDHNIRIQDMGRIMSTSSEDEAVEILRKYMVLTSEQCQELKNRFGDIVPEDACSPVSEVYLIASNDLIVKYYWMSFFGTGTGRSYFQLPLSSFDQTQGIFSYADGTVSLAWQNNQFIPIYQNKYIIKEVVYFDLQTGELQHLVFENATDTVDGMLWVDPSYQISIFMDPAIKDSLFTRLFFWNGQGLEHFELKLNNPEIRLYKVNF